MFALRAVSMRNIAMKGTPLIVDAALPPGGSRRWWLFPIFWSLVFCIGLALSTLTLAQNRPDQLVGLAGVRLAALLLGQFAAYMLVAWAWLYRDQPLLAWRGPLLFVVQMALLLLLIELYGAAFAWISLALLYPVIGGLPARQWPLPLVALLLVFVVGSWPTDSSAEASATALLSIGLQISVNFGIALVLRLMSSQSRRLRTALDELRQANLALAAGTEQKQELAVLRERARLARAMHDNIGHALVVMNIKLEAAQLLYARDPARGDAELEATRALIRTSMADLRRALADLRAPAAEHDDLPGALGRLAHELQARTGIAVACSIAADLPPMPVEAREAIWYVAREALTNAERHAGAASLTLSLAFWHNGWLLRVVDDGAGMNHKDLRRPNHYGVQGMRERMKEIDGQFDIRRGASGGTIVEAYLPQHVVQEARAA
jgi:signal transduction histidine kinase